MVDVDGPALRMAAAPHLAETGGVIVNVLSTRKPAAVDRSLSGAGVVRELTEVIVRRGRACMIV